MDKKLFTEAEYKRLMGFAKLSLEVGKRRKMLLDKIRDALLRGEDGVALSLMKEYVGIKDTEGK